MGQAAHRGTAAGRDQFSTLNGALAGNPSNFGVQ